MRVPAIVTAGDRRSAKAIQGESKVYLEIAGRPLVAHVVATLQRVPEVSGVWVVGDAERLERVLGPEALGCELTKPLTIVPQFRNLYENAWETYRRLLPGAAPGGRDPGPEDEDVRVLYLSADLPFATPQEISEFLRKGMAFDSDYVLGLVDAEALEHFRPTEAGEPGVEMAYFNVREGRLRQNNLHLVRPTGLGNRHYIEEMYEHRYQREVGNIIGLAWRILRSEGGGLRVLLYYALIHLAGVVDRWGWRGFADVLRRRIPLERVEAGVSALLAGRFRFALTQAGGCALDIDSEADYEVAKLRFPAWRKLQEARALSLYGVAPPGPETSGSPHELRVLPGGPS